MRLFLKQPRVLAFGCCLFFLLLNSACTQQPPDTRAADEATIRHLDAQWSKAASANDLDGAVAFYSDDATVLPPNAPVAATKQAIRTLWASLLVPGATVSWQAARVEVSTSGDLGYLLGTYVVTLKDPQGKPVDSGKLAEVWKKQPDGKWKCVVDTYNSNLPLATPQEKGK
jgi:ketosteroid isomerase-like protein